MDDPMASPSLAASLSVREICAFDLFAEVDVLAGAAGLDRKVQRLNVMTVPDIVRWTKAHELLLTTGYPLPKSASGLVELLTELDARGVAAVGVKYGPYGPGLALEALRAADELGLPIIDLPESVAFDDVLSLVLSDITNRQAAALARAHELHEALLGIVLRGGGLDDIVQELSSVLGGAAVFYIDPAGRIAAHTTSMRHPDVPDASDAVAVERLCRAGPDTAGLAMAIAPVVAGSFEHGNLLAVTGAGDLPPDAEAMVQQSAMVAALEVTNRFAVRAVERHFESSALHELLTGGKNDVGEGLARAESFGWDLDRPLLVLVARRDRHGDTTGEDVRHEHDIDAWAAAVRALDRTAAAAGLGRDLVAVCGVDNGAEPVARTLSKAVSGTTRSSVSIGVSAPVRWPAHLPAGYQNARTSLEVGQKVYGPGAIAPYESLGLLRLLNAVSDPSELRTFVDDSLGQVLALRKTERVELLRTLDVLLDQRLNVAESARTLHFHYNTMRYRIRKLQQLVGPFFDDGQLRLRLSVALQILRMWEMSTSTTDHD